MHSRSRFLPLSALLPLLLLAVPAHAETTSPVPPTMAGDLPNAVPMVSGGIGEDEYEAIEGEKNQFNLRLLFTEQSGAYISDVRVKIADKSGNIIAQTHTKGPVLLVQLGTGTYSIVAQQGSVLKDTRLSVKAGKRTEYHFRFPNSPDNFD